MFLFEDFTYDESWAATHYGDSFHHTNWYLEGIINDWQYMQSLPNKDDIKRFHFAVSRMNLNGISDNNIFKITISEHIYNEPDPPFRQDQVDYLTNKLSILGDAVKIIIPSVSGMMVIQYFIEKDEYRWNKEHKRVQDKEDAVNSIQIPEPSIDCWLEMLNDFNYGKNPRVIFKKAKTLDELLEKLVIAIKLQWYGATNAISHQMHRFLKSDIVNKNNPLDNTYDAAYKFALTYEIPEIIQEIMEGDKEGFKHIGPIPTKGKYLANKLDDNEYVRKYWIKPHRKQYSYDPILYAYVELTNDKSGYIVITQPSLYHLKIYKTIEIVKGSVVTKDENMIGEDKYWSVFNKGRSNHVLNDTIDLYLDEIIQNIYNN